MKKERLITVANELNSILFDPDKKEKGWIYTDIDEKELLKEVKHGALWLWATDELTPEVAETLREIKWDKADFENLKDDQDPLPAFIKFGIIQEDDEEGKVVKPKPPVKKPPKVSKKKKETNEAGEYKNAPKPKPKDRSASAYNTALTIAGTDPRMPVSELHKIIGQMGFDLGKTTATTRTAHSIMRRCFRILMKNGWINEQKFNEK
jgi:hypothetical protein